MSGRSFWLACLTFMTAAAPAAAAPPGFLDGGFENGSRFVTHIPQPRVSVGGLVPGPHGGSYVVANTETSEFSDASDGGTLLLVRYDRRGRPVRSFGHLGTYTTDFPAGPVKAMGMVRQRDGKLVVVGSIGARDQGEHHAFIARFFPDGTLDGVFGHGGLLVIDLDDGCCEVANDVALDPRGGFIVAGVVHSGLREAFVARIRADGTPDPAFGSGGVVRRASPPIDTQSTSARAVTLAPDGTIFFAGRVERSTPRGTFRTQFVARLSADGADPHFSEVGSPGVAFNEIAFDGTRGRLYAAGSFRGEDSIRTKFLLLAYRADLSAIGAFGEDGDATADFAGTREDTAATALVDRRGRIVLAGAAVGPPPMSVFGPSARSDFALARFTPQGRLDRSFGRRGRGRVRFRQRQNVARALIEQRGGRLLLAGTGGGALLGQVLEATGTTVALARVRPD